MAWHEQGKGKRPSYLFKLKLTSNVKKAIAKVSWDHWQGKPNEGLVQLAELKLKLAGWSCVCDDNYNAALTTIKITH